MKAFHFSAIIAAASLASSANAAVSLTAAGYSQNFDTLASSGTENTAVPAGVLIYESGHSPNQAGRISDYDACVGICFGPQVFSFGAIGNVERALGSIGFENRFDNYTPSFGIALTNDTGAALTSVSVSYYGELWRTGQASAQPAPDQLDVSYVVGAETLIGDGFVDVDALDFVGRSSPISEMVDGNADANRRFLSATINFAVPIAAGETFTLRWLDGNVGQNPAQDGLAIDDLVISVPTAAIPEPASWAMMIAGLGLVGATARRRKTNVAFA